MKKPNARLLFLGAAAALVTAVIAGGTALLLIEDRPAFPLLDGTRIQIDGVKYGDTDPIVYGPAWKRRLHLLAPYLPPALAAPIRTGSADLGAARLKDTLTVWLEYDGNWGISSPFCILRDSHGCRFRSAEAC